MTESGFQPYSDRFTRAFETAHQLHRHQLRKGTPNSYLSHILAVTALVIENGGDEDEVIAALLHDGPEDAGGRQTLEEIREEFGDGVADIVEHCTDAFEDPKPEWWTRKLGYHEKLRNASASALLVSVADKVHNAEATAEDLRTLGPGVWDRFKEGRDGPLWNYARLLEIYREKSPSGSRDLVDRLERALDSLFESEAEKVLARFFDPSSLMPAGSPTLRVVSGAVCTGKSRFIREQLNSGYVHLDAPRIFLAMCRGQVLDFPGELEEKMEGLGRSVARRAIEERRNIVVELIGQDNKPLELMLKQLKACGYEIKFDTLTCDVEVALERNRQRGEDNISAYYAEGFHLRWLIEESAECARAQNAGTSKSRKKRGASGSSSKRKAAIRKYAGSTVGKLRSCLQRSLDVPEETTEIAALPGAQEITRNGPAERGYGDFLVPVESARLTRCLRELSVREGISFLGHVFRAGVGGNGTLFAIPEGMTIRATDPDLESTLEQLAPAISAFEGKQCFRAYLEASLLIREISEFGAWWHGLSWGPHVIVDSNPLGSEPEDSTPARLSQLSEPDQWQWSDPIPVDWRWSVELGDGGGATVRFITHQPVGRETFILHTDRYQAGSWLPESSKRVLGSGPSGIIF